jgi:hypothetical protein
MNYTDKQLKEALTLLLPNVIYFDGQNDIYWDAAFERKVSEAELLDLCSLVEETLTSPEVTALAK